MQSEDGNVTKSSALMEEGWHFVGAGEATFGPTYIECATTMPIVDHATTLGGEHTPVWACSQFWLVTCDASDTHACTFIIICCLWDMLVALPHTIYIQRTDGM